jgi:hypothetical protein
MPPYVTNFALLKLCAEQLTKEGLVPFTRRDLVRRVHKIDPARNEQSLNPTIQGMTVNLKGGVGARECVFYSVGRGLFELYDPAKRREPDTEEPAATPPSPAPQKSVNDQIGARSLTLANQTAAREFAYEGETQLSEEEVKQAVNSALLAEGWTTRVKWGYEQGIDIDARRGSERLVLGARGDGPISPTRLNYFVGVLGELMHQADSPDCRYGLALPAHPQFINLALNLRERLNVCFYFVRPAGAGVYDVGLLEQAGGQ